MTIAIMQPYIFPYIGYFQMVQAVDKFVFYDDVNFIKKGWINRNRILNQNSPFLFTVPLSKVSQNKLICDTAINMETYGKWVDNFEQMLRINYSKAPYFDAVNQMVISVLRKKFDTINELAADSVIEVSKYLGIEKSFVRSSTKYNNRELGRQERLIDICKREDAAHYINAPGGMELYTKEDFKKEGVKLEFIHSLPVNYHQFSNEFVPWLSIIDVLMFNAPNIVLKMTKQYKLV